MTNNDDALRAKMMTNIANGAPVTATILPWTPPQVCNCADDSTCNH